MQEMKPQRGVKSIALQFLEGVDSYVYAELLLFCPNAGVLMGGWNGCLGDSRGYISEYM